MNKLKQIQDKIAIIYYAFINPFYGLYVFFRNLPIYFQHPKLLDLDFLFFYYYKLFYSGHKYHEEKTSTKIKDIVELTYGETPYFTLKKIIKKIPIKKEQIFIDLGCGRGRLVFFVNKHFKLKSIGIDLIPTYIKVANFFKQKKKITEVEFYLADILNHDFSKGDIFYIAWTCLNKETIKQIEQRLINLKRGSYVITTSMPVQNKNFKVIKEFKLPFSWGYGHVYLNQRV